jgi:3-methyladenine DNA glycosylase AlkD
MHTKVLEYLKTKQDETYRDFTSKLLPKNIELLGVRIPIIRQYAKQLIKENLSDEYLVISLDKMKYQEEIFLYSLLLAHKVKTSATKIEDIKKFVPYINSWAVCDIFCGELKEIKKDTNKYMKSFLPYTKSKKEYQIRFFYVLALNYFMQEDYLEWLFDTIEKQQYVGYYDKMAVAWFLSIAYIKFPSQVEGFLLSTPIDTFVFSKTISKICDSYQVKKEAKIHLRKLASEIKSSK